MKASLPILMLLGAATAQAAPVPPTQLAPGPRAPAPTRIPGVSDAGNAILAKAQTTPDPQLTSIGRQQRVVHDQIVGAVMAPTIDMAKFGALLKQQQMLVAQVLSRRDERLLQVAGQLSPADRSAFLRALLAATPPAAPH